MTLNQLVIFFLAVVVSSAWCFGLHVVVKRLILEEIFDYDLDAKWDGDTVKTYKETLQTFGGLPRWKKLIFKPLFACPYCMASVWGTAIFWTAFSYMGIAYWIPFCICLCGFNYFLNQFVAE